MISMVMLIKTITMIQIDDTTMLLMKDKCRIVLLFSLLQRAEVIVRLADLLIERSSTIMTANRRDIDEARISE